MMQRGRNVLDCIVRACGNLQTDKRQVPEHPFPFQYSLRPGFRTSLMTRVRSSALVPSRGSMVTVLSASSLAPSSTPCCPGGLNSSQFSGLPGGPSSSPSSPNLSSIRTLPSPPSPGMSSDMRSAAPPSTPSSPPGQPSPGSVPFTCSPLLSEPRMLFLSDPVGGDNRETQ